MTVQRRRGQPATIWKTKVVTDRRGNTTKMPDLDSDPIAVTAAFIPQRSSRAEVPGQQQIDVYRMILDPNLPDVDLWSRVRWNGRDWDIVSPPTLHYGVNRHTRHWAMDIRERP